MTCPPCCDEGIGRCPSDTWITMDRWVGPRTIPNNLYNVHLRPFRLRFTHPTLGSSLTSLIPITASIQDIKDALGVLPNFGLGMTVMSQGGLATTGKLPDEALWIWFDTTLTQGLDIVPLTVIYDDPPTIDGWEVSTIRKGGSGVDAIQSLKRRPGVWELGNFEQYENSVWFWRVIPYQSSKKVPDLTEICIQQNRRDWTTWTTPFRDGLESKFYSLKTIGLRWEGSPFTSTIVSGSYDLKLTVGGNAQTAVGFTHNGVGTTLQSTLQGLSNASGAGTITVGGGPSPLPFAVTFTDPSQDTTIQVVNSNFLGTPPPIDTIIQQEGGSGVNETQVLDYRWPATGGDFTITVTNPLGGPFTTAAIPFDADKTVIQSALLALPNLNTTPNFTVTLTSPGLIQRIAVTGGAVVTGGTYRLSINVRGTTAFTSPLPANAPASVIQAALLALPNMLPTDNITVQAAVGNVGIIDLQFGGTLTASLPITVGTVSSLMGGDVFVASTTTSTPDYIATAFTVHTKHYLTFVGSLANTNVPSVTVTSNLINNPQLITQEEHSNSRANDFRNFFEALNVGTIWKHYIRTAYGHSANRALRVDYLRNMRELYVGNPGITPTPAEMQFQPCGLGYFGFTQRYQCDTRNWFWQDYPTPGQQQVSIPGPHGGVQFQEYKAEFVKENGTIQVTSDSTQIELAFQVRCLGCHFSAEFNPWGTHEQSTNGYFSPFSVHEFITYGDGIDTGKDSCPIIPPDPGVCREWDYRSDNVPYLLRKRWGPDGFDGSLINDKFWCDEGGLQTRKPPCEPDVVLMSNGFWLEQNRSRWISAVEVKGGEGGSTCEIACPPKLKRESLIENPTSDIDRLRLLFGSKFSYWGGWIDLDYSVEQGHQIRCKFSQFDLTDIKVLILGGLPTRTQHTHSDSWIDQQAKEVWEGYYASSIAMFGGTPGGQGTAFVDGVVQKDFEPGTLNALKQWLDQPGRVLLLDGGVFPNKFLSALGCQSTVETFNDWNNPNVELATPNTLNGTLDKGIQNIAGLVFQQANGGGLPVWGPDYFYPISNSPTVLNSLTPLELVPPSPRFPHPFTENAAIPISQKYKLPSPNSPWYGYQISKEYLVAPVSKMQSYTTGVPLVAPSSKAVPIFNLRGSFLVPPFHDFVQYYFTPVDYPAVVAETWRNDSFVLRFNFLGTVCDTLPILFTATSTDIQNALQLLPNIGATPTVAGGPLSQGSIDIWFDTPLTQGQDVPLLEVIGSQLAKVSLMRDGGGGVDEMQRLEKNASPSRVIIHNIVELVDPQAWGLNYFSTKNYGVDPSSPKDGDSVWGQNGDNNLCRGEIITPPVGSPFCRILCGGQLGGGGFYSPVDYGVDGYAWGLGLTHIANDQFLLNLLERRNDY